MSKSEIRIDILGTSLTISADADPHYLQSLLEQYKQFVGSTQALTGLQDPLKIAVLSGFLLCDELEKTKNSSREKAETTDNPEYLEAEKLALELINRIDEALGDK